MLSLHIKTDNYHFTPRGHFMNTEQQEYIHLINCSKPDEILIKKTGWEEVNLVKHSHNKLQIIYILSGTLHIELERNNYFVPERRIAWIPADMEHKLSSNSCQVSLIIFYLELDSLTEHSRKVSFSIYNTNTLVSENLNFISSQGKYISKTLNPDLYWFILSFFNLLPRMSPETEFLFKTLIIPSDSRLRPVIDYIAEHLNEDLRLERLATMFHFSTRNLSRLFRESGLHFSSYVNNLRIMRAIELLTDGQKSIQEIAYETGFSAPTNFNRVFKQIVGTSPKLYIKK